MGMSRSSQIRPSMYGVTSEDGWISTSSVHTTAQPPSALTPRMRARVAVPHAVAVGHLEEPVAGGDRADRDRLEQHVEARLAHELSVVVVEGARRLPGRLDD